MDRNGVIHDTANEFGYTGYYQAKDIGVPGSGVSKGQGTGNSNIVGMEIIARDEKDVTPAQRDALVRFANERYPNVPFYGHGEISTNKEANEGVPGAQAVLASRPAPFNFDWSNAPIPGPPNERPVSAPTSSYGPLATQEAPAEAVPLPMARPAAANIAQANSVLDSRVIDLVRKGSPGDVDRIPSSIANQTLREALGNTMTGGMIRSGLTPYLPQMGVSQAEFDKAYASGGQRAQPLRFGEAGGSMGGELPTAGSFSPYPGFRQSANFEDRSAEPPLGADVFGPRSSVFDLSPGGFGAGGYGNTFQPPPNMQQGPTMPPWQANIPPAYRNPEVIAAVEEQARQLGVPPEAIVSVAQIEGSGWNPQHMTGTQAGIFQIAPDDFRTAGGTLGGMTYDQYRKASPAQQVAAYGDYIRSSPNAAYLDAASGDPALAASLMQGIQFSPQSDAFSKEFLAGNQDFQIAHDDKGRAPFYTGQADALRYTTINDMRNAFARMIGNFPQTQTLPGGR